METTMPDVPFCLLNRVLFGGKRFNHLYKTFGSVSAVDYKFPHHLLADGLHPSMELAKEIWIFLHKSVCNVHDKITGKKVEPTPSTSKDIVIQMKEKITFKSRNYRNRQGVKKPYAAKKINLSPKRVSVHSRLFHPQEDEIVEELIEEAPVGHYGNLLWKASDQVKRPNPTQKTQIIYDQAETSAWSWNYHRRVIAEAKAAVYTQGLREQIYAKGRLATIIRERGLWSADQGQLKTVNVAADKWMEKQHAELNDPHQDAKLVQEDLAKLLPVVDSSASSEEDV
ncbi:unnamed protein product [Rotaria socialis]|uniref:Uncharacterized protein n=2 Tax=Rotaria socialis TaxID=392032 RepID=A0A821WAZ4_9BILA|nr:unnamed protein product [Rotaria socialis]